MLVQLRVSTRVCRQCQYTVRALSCRHLHSAANAAAMHAEEMLASTYAPALEDSILQLQDSIEGTCFMLKKQEGKRDAAAGAHAR